MTDLAAPQDLLGVTEWDALVTPEHQSWELVDGRILVAPKASPFHNRAMMRVASLVEAAAPDCVALVETEVLLDAEHPATVRAPDVLLVDPAAYRANPPRFSPGQVELVVEIVSAGSRRTDYVAKRYDYELARIPHYWIIDLDERRATCLQLRNGAYHEQQLTAGPRVHLPDPAPSVLVWDELT